MCFEVPPPPGSNADDNKSVSDDNDLKDGKTSPLHSEGNDFCITEFKILQW